MGVVNFSNSINTVKSMTESLSLDNYCIDKTLLYCKYNTNLTKIELENILDKYRDYFDQFLEEEDLDPKYWYQPAYFAEMYYGTPDLDFLVLYFARISTLLDFKKKKIKVLPRNRLPEINKLFVENRLIVSKSYNEPKSYFTEIL